MVALLTDADRARLQAAVAEAEHKTSGEIVLAIATTSDRYAAYPMAWTVVGQIVLAGVLALTWPEMHLRMAFTIFCAATCVIAALLHWHPLHLLLVPKAAKDHAVRNLARLEFSERVSGRTQQANGLLIFISLSEHAVHVIPEARLGDAVSDSVWATIVDTLAQQVKKENLVVGLATAIDACAQIMAEKFPPRAGDRDEIPNDVIMAGPLA